NAESVFSAIDLVPSLVRLGGAQKPAGAQYDGEELLGTLLGKAESSRKEPIFFARPVGFKKMPMPGFEEQLPDLAVRSGKWKLLCDYDGSRPQLYDLDTDPGETNNLTEKHADKTRQLVREVTAWHRDVSAGAAPEALD
ncbi:MAG: N-acetylgalactosamine-6-sulfatase, partial [Akkermansiaceae bacterium]